MVCENTVTAPPHRTDLTTRTDSSYALIFHSVSIMLCPLQNTNPTYPLLCWLVSSIFRQNLLSRQEMRDMRSSVLLIVFVQTPQGCSSRGDQVPCLSSSVQWEKHHEISFEDRTFEGPIPTDEMRQVHRCSGVNSDRPCYKFVIEACASLRMPQCATCDFSETVIHNQEKSNVFQKYIHLAERVFSMLLFFFCY